LASLEDDPVRRIDRNICGTVGGIYRAFVLNPSEVDASCLSREVDRSRPEREVRILVVVRGFDALRGASNIASGSHARRPVRQHKPRPREDALHYTSLEIVACLNREIPRSIQSEATK